MQSTKSAQGIRLYAVKIILNGNNTSLGYPKTSSEHVRHQPIIVNGSFHGFTYKAFSASRCLTSSYSSNLNNSFQGATKFGPPRPSSLPAFHNRVPRGGFFFAGSLVPDPEEEKMATGPHSNIKTESAANMTHVTEVKQDKKEGSAAYTVARSEAKPGMQSHSMA